MNFGCKWKSWGNSAPEAARVTYYVLYNQPPIRPHGPSSGTVRKRVTAKQAAKIVGSRQKLTRARERAIVTGKPQTLLNRWGGWGSRVVVVPPKSGFSGVNATTGYVYFGNMGSEEAPLGEEGAMYVWRSADGQALYGLNVINMYYAGADTDNPEETCIVEHHVELDDFKANTSLIRYIAHAAGVEEETVREDPAYYMWDLASATNRYEQGHKCFDTFEAAARYLIKAGVPHKELKMYL